MPLGPKDATLAWVLAPKETLEHGFKLTSGHLSAHYGSEVGTIPQVLALKWKIIAFWLPRWHFGMGFGSPEDIWVCLS